VSKHQKHKIENKKQRKGAHARMLRGSGCLGLRLIATPTPYHEMRRIRFWSDSYGLCLG
jgi:hypothetical protein